jgi:hypothetical protein
MKYYLSALCPYCEKADINDYITSLIDERTKDLNDDESNAIDYDKLHSKIYDELWTDEIIVTCFQCHRINEGDNINDYKRDL